MTVRQPKATRPETLRQARSWQQVLGVYRTAGLCDRCAAQAAYGHAVGFSLIHPPCQGCVPIVARLPLQAVQGSPWRRLRKGSTRAAAATLEPATAVGVPQDHPGGAS